MAILGPPGPPGSAAESLLLPPELLFRNELSMTKGEERMKRDLDAMEQLASEIDDADIDELMGVERKTTTRRSTSKRKKTSTKDELAPKFLDMYSSIYTMRQELERIRRPIGIRENPARTCKELLYAHQKLENGWYWIDPNSGMIDDAIYVYCNMVDKGETCVYPDKHSSQIPTIAWRKEGGQLDWFSSMRGGSRITYESVGASQMKFLRMLSETAYQNFTYTCMNSVAWFNSNTENFDMSIKFLGDNDAEMGYESHPSIKPAIIKDGCITGRSKSESIFEIRTKKIDVLPIVDFYPTDYADQQQQKAFGFQMGPVCFK